MKSCPIIYRKKQDHLLLSKKKKTFGIPPPPLQPKNQWHISSHRNIWIGQPTVSMNMPIGAIMYCVLCITIYSKFHPVIECSKWYPSIACPEYYRGRQMLPQNCMCFLLSSNLDVVLYISGIKAINFIYKLQNTALL